MSQGPRHILVGSCYAYEHMSLGSESVFEPCKKTKKKEKK